MRFKPMPGCGIVGVNALYGFIRQVQTNRQGKMRGENIYQAAANAKLADRAHFGLAPITKISQAFRQ